MKANPLKNSKLANEKIEFEYITENDICIIILNNRIFFILKR